MSSYERLSAQDAAFLEFEDENNPMHVAAMLTFDPTPVVEPGGDIPVDSIRTLISGRLGLLPKYRQKIVRTPVTGSPVWVDDAHFDLRQHLRHVSLPKPGTWETFTGMFEEFLSQKLDVDRPLWELWIVEGLEDGRVGLMGKVHHCLIDGVSGVDMMMLLLGFEPSMEVPEAPPWTPRPGPTAQELLVAEARRALDIPGLVAGGVRSVLADPQGAIGELQERSAALASVGQVLTRSGRDTEINGHLGPHRQFRGATVSLAEVKAFRQALGGTVNDVVVGLLSGALRTYLAGRGEDVDKLDLRATIPMSTRTEAERGTLGNKLAVVAAGLPVHVADRLQRMDAARASMENLKDSNQALATDLLTRIAEWTTPNVLTQGVKFALRLRLTHIMITNIRGPDQPLYCMAAPMMEVFPAPELWTDQALGVGVLSYNGELRFGFVGNRESLGDLDEFVAAFEAEVAAIRDLAGVPGPDTTTEESGGKPKRRAARA